MQQHHFRYPTVSEIPRQARESAPPPQPAARPTQRELVQASLLRCPGRDAHATPGRYA